MGSQLVQLLLPLADKEGRVFPDHILEGVKQRLVERFGGVTAYTRSPAEGVWAPRPNKCEKDDVVIVEVMAPELDEAWWSGFQRELERALGQDEIVVRAFPIRTLK